MLIALHIVGLTGAVILTMLCIAPVLSFYTRGWAIKKNDVMRSFNPEAKLLYFKFCNEVHQPDNPDKAFEDLYVDRYGRKHLHIPMAFLTIILIALLFLVIETALARIVVFHNGQRSLVGALTAAPLFGIPAVAVAGIVGAFLWVTSDLVQRCRIQNLTPGDLQNSALRLSMAAPMGYSLGALANPSLGSFLAFAFGAFPLAQVTAIFRRLINQQLNISTDSNEGQLKKLEGVDAPISDKLLDAGVTTISQLAYCDPVQLCMRTGLDFSYVMDIAAQALAWIYFEDTLNKLRPLGFRGAVEFRDLYDNLSSDNATVRATAEELLATAAATVDISAQGFRHAIYQIALDPYTEFLDAIWGEEPESSSHDDHPPYRSPA
jgi:hypothetical protein